VLCQKVSNIILKTKNLTQSMKIDWVFLFYIGRYRWMLISSIHVAGR